MKRFLFSLSRSNRFKKALRFIVMFLFALYVFCIPSFSESNGLIRYSIYFSLFFLALICIIYTYLYGSFALHKKSYLFFIFAFIALIGTIAYSHNFRGWFSLILLCFSFLVLFLCFKIINNPNAISVLISISFFIFSIYYIIVYRSYFINPALLFSSRLGFYFDNPNGISAYATVGFAFSFYCLFFLERKLKFFFVIPSFAIFSVGLSTGSRTFILTSIFIVIVELYFVFKKHKLWYLVSIIALVSIFIGIINLPVFSSFRDRLFVSFETFFGIADKPDTSTISRTIWTDYGFWLAGKRLLFGYGSGGFAIASGIGTYSHSNFAEIICDFGIFGFILFYYPLVYILIKTIINKNPYSKLIIPLIFYYLLVGFSNVFYYKKIYYLVLALVFFLDFRQQSLAKLKSICFMCDSMNSGGAEKVISILGNQFASRGLNVTILGVSDHTNSKSFYKLENNCVYRPLCISEKRVKPFKRLILLIRYIFVSKPDLIISFLPHVNIYSMFVSFVLRTPFIVSERNDPKNYPKRKILRILRNISFFVSSGCVFQADQAMDYYPFFVRKKSIIIMNPIVVEDGIQASNSFLKEIVTVGRLTYQKNQKCLLEAFALFNSRNSNEFRLNIFGEGELKENLMDYAIRLGIQNNVAFLGNDIDWHRKCINSYAFVLSSDYEGFPNALAEALCMGIPSVSTDCPVGCSRLLIEDGQNGFLTSTNNPASLCEKLCDIKNLNREKVIDFSKKLKKRLSPDMICKDWISYICEKIGFEL